MVITWDSQTWARITCRLEKTYATPVVSDSAGLRICSSCLFFSITVEIPHYFILASGSQQCLDIYVTYEVIPR